MAGYLLFVIFMSVLFETKGQDLAAPKLSVDSLLITVTGFVTLNCQTSVPVSDCFFILDKPPAQQFPCLKTLSGRELLSMVNKLSPAEVSVTCFYLKVTQSPHSETHMISVQENNHNISEVLPAPKLTVDPRPITKTDSITLNCQTPVPVFHCFFILDKPPAQQFPCLKTLSGRELLSMVNKSAPTQVTLTCFYLRATESPHSDRTTVSVQDLAPPTLTVSPSVITEVDNVTLHCQTPASVSAVQCKFYILSGNHWHSSTCVQTIKGSELLKVNKRLPATIQLQCAYTVTWGQTVSSSPNSDKRTVSVQSSKPEISVQHDPDQFDIVCSLPGSAKTDSPCYLYFGESTQPFLTTNITSKRTTKDRTICHFTVTVEDLQRNLAVFKTTDISCDYSLESGHNSLSPRSDRYNMSDAVAKITAVTTMTPTSSDSVTTTSPCHVTGSETEKIHSPRNSSSTKTFVLKLVILLCVCGVIVGCVLLVLAFFCTKQTNGKVNSQDPNSGGLPLTGEYSLVASVPAAGSDSVTVNTEESKHEDVNEINPYHLYASIPEEPTSVSVKNIIYSSLQNTDP